jgi:hypothetical protein
MIAGPPPVTQPGTSSTVPLEDTNAAETLWEYGENVIPETSGPTRLNAAFQNRCRHAKEAPEQ